MSDRAEPKAAQRPKEEAQLGAAAGDHVVGPRDDLARKAHAGRSAGARSAGTRGLLSGAGRVLVSKKAKLNNALDLTDARVRRRLGVRKADLVKSKDYSKTQALGDWAKAHGYDGILAPSARNATGSNLIGFGGL